MRLRLVHPAIVQISGNEHQLGQPGVSDRTLLTPTGRTLLPRVARSAEPVGDVFAMGKGAGQADQRFAAGDFGSLAE